MKKSFYVIPLFAVLALASCGNSAVVVPEVDESKVVSQEEGLDALKTAVDKTFANDSVGLSCQKTYVDVDYHEYAYEGDTTKDTNQVVKLNDVGLKVAMSGLQSTTPETDFKAEIDLKAKSKISLDLGLEKPIACDETLNPRAYVANSNLYFNLESQFYSDVASAVVTMITRAFMPTAPEQTIEVPASGYLAGVVEFEEGVTAAEGLKDMVMDLFAQYGGQSPVSGEEAEEVLKDNIKVVKNSDKNFTAFISYDEKAPEGEAHKGEYINVAACLNFSTEKGLVNFLARGTGDFTETVGEAATEEEAAEMTPEEQAKLNRKIKFDVSCELDFAYGNSVKVNLPNFDNYEEVVIS